jgi:UDP-N-acetylglucosamine 1-carboxyvinyltransferase
MDRIRIVGGQRLNGTIPISGAKNATLPLMIASLLTEDTLILDNAPRLADVELLQRILGNHGVDVMIAGKRPGDDPNSGRTLHISAKHIIDTTAPCWRAWARPKCRCPAAAPSAPGRSIS